MLQREKQPRVLIVRLGAMGDILHALPAVTLLRAAHPQWFLGWAVEPQWRALLSAGAEPGEACAATAQMPLVDRVHPIPAKQWSRQPWSLSTWRQVLACRRDVRHAGYDVCVDLQGAVRSALVARWARPARLIGEAAPREPVARWLFSERVQTHGVHVIEQAVDILGALAPGALQNGHAEGSQAVDEASERASLPLPALPYDPAAAAWCDLHAPTLPFVLMSPGAGWGAKRWPLDRYAAVARALLAEGLAVVVNASLAERELGEAIARQSGAVALVPTLGQLIELTRRAALAIAGDTGPLHLAAALGRPTVGIYGPTDPARNGPYHGLHIVLRHPASRRDHARRVEPEAGLLTITPQEVLSAARSLLSAAAAPLSAPSSSSGWTDDRTTWTTSTTEPV